MFGIFSGAGWAWGNAALVGDRYDLRAVRRVQGEMTVCGK